MSEEPHGSFAHRYGHFAPETSTSNPYSPEECVEDEFLEPTRRQSGQGADGMTDEEIERFAVGVEGVRAHPGVDSEGGGRVVQRRARRRDTDSRCTARATAARAPEGHRRLS